MMTRLAASLLLATTCITIGGCETDDALATQAATQAATMPTTQAATQAAQDMMNVDLPANVPAQARATASRDGDYIIAYLADPTPIPVNDLFGLQIWLLDMGGQPLNADMVALAVDADMPHHGHGMIVEPELTRLADGSYRVENMMFHMGGYWELYFDITKHNVTERTIFSVTIE
ncbi:MAG: hypothetical protein AAF432_10835 [Planctomycetota bacterium]